MTTRLVARFEKRFGPETRIRCDWSAPAGEFSLTVLFGPSGCGKTTILRCLAGLERPETGEIRLGESAWFDAGKTCLPPQRRGIGFLFQEYALFPHLTVGQNIGYGLRHLPPSERRQRVQEMLEALQIAGLEQRLPRQISGGQQQRVALARAIACRPRLLLLDEPLSALDAPTRDQLRRELRRLLSAGGVPVVLVTHDRDEAISLADQLLVLDRGEIRQSGPVDDVFSRPADLNVARIVGVETVAPCELFHVHEGLARVRLGNVELTAMAPPETQPLTQPRPAHVCIRAEDVLLERSAAPTSARNQLAATITHLWAEGPLVRVGLDCGFSLTALITRPAAEELSLAPGLALTALIKAQAVHLVFR